jgi:hypothetical protein
VGVAAYALVGRQGGDEDGKRRRAFKKGAAPIASAAEDEED